MQTLKLRHEITIHALASKLWKVLTCSEYTDQFLFDGRLVSDWNEGGAIMLVEEKGDHNQVRTVGQVEDVIPGLSLRFQLLTIGEHFNGPVLFHYELSPAPEGIRLSLFQEAPENGLVMLREYSTLMLQKIKWLAEYA